MLSAMKKYVWLFLLTVVVILPLSGEAQEKHSLWRVDSPTNTVYLLGSLHMLKQAHYPLRPALEAAFSDARHLVTEANVDELESPTVLAEIMQKAAYPSGASLQASISQKAYQLTEHVVVDFEAMGVNMGVLNGLKPWFVSITLVGLKLQQLGFSPSSGIDRYFFKKAKDSGMGLHALETSSFQINLLSSLSEQDQELMLLQTLKELEVTEKLFDEMYTTWRDGDTDGLATLLSESFREYPAVYEKLIVARNRNWVPRIESYLKQEENYVVVVGAGHLVGEDSVVQMLTSKGYGVDQL